MKKGAVLILLLFVLIGLWKFSQKLNTKPRKQVKKETELVEKPEKPKKEFVEVVEEKTINQPLVHYNYLPKTKDGIIVKHKFYTLSYNEKYEQAEWVAYKLNTRFIQGNAQRASSFYYDDAVLTKSAGKDDYLHSGYDRGHLLPAADRKMTREAMRETFYMSNISPQAPGLDRKAWKYLEETIRDRAYDYDSLYIITGPIIFEQHEKLGENEVAVPAYFYKIILNYTNSSSLCATAFIFPNQSVKHLTEDYIVSIDSVEAATGIDFFAQLPRDVQANFESKQCLQMLE